LLRTFYQQCRKRWYLALFLMLSLSCFLSVLIPPSAFWPAVFTSYAIPGVVIINLLLLVILPLFNFRLVIFPLLAILAGSPFLFVSVNYSIPTDNKRHDLSVLSFNAKTFRKLKVNKEFSFDMIKWVVNDSSAVKCIQEYSTNSQSAELDVNKQMSEKGHNSFIYTARVDDAENSSGIAIFTKYNILDSGYVWTNHGTTNAGIFVDILCHDDTIRIYNVHMESNHLRLYQYKDPDRYPGKVKGLISKLKYGAEARSHQVDRLIAHTNACPYPYIICGDFNETPYSYNYFKLRAQFNNAFEEAGSGFGFTFNSILFFLRIDHQFYNQQVKAAKFRVDRSMKLSDHFPTRGYYRIK
jgi:endonuclease/exonuclease/phosphatase family metal-dependent hydrolase